MKILITGASGFIGQHLIIQLMRANHELILLSRNPTSLQNIYGKTHQYIKWDSLSGPPPKEAFSQVDTIINLMGEGVANKRWTKQQKQKIYDTRIKGTQHLIDGALKHANTLSTLIQASAIGYYDHYTDQEIDTNSPPSSDFLGQLCQDWESTAASINKRQNVRTVYIRIGLVIGNGGALTKLTAPFLLGLGGKIGSGKQWMNWIHVEDLTRLIIKTMQDKTCQGPYNGVAHQNATNKTFTKTLGSILKRPTLFTVPKWVLKIILGELAKDICRGQKINSNNIKKLDFKFNYPDLHSALENALGIKYIPHLNKKIRCQQLHTHQYIQKPPKDIFNFFSDVHNLERITPPFLHFKITSQSTQNIQQNTLFTYKLRIRGIPIKWTTLICNWNPISSFIDTQLKGPYYVWHHTHTFTPYKKGTFLEDHVYYALPRIPFLNLLRFFIRKDIINIFNYRKNTTHSLLNSSKNNSV